MGINCIQMTSQQTFVVDQAHAPERARNGLRKPGIPYNGTFRPVDMYHHSYESLESSAIKFGAGRLFISHERHCRVMWLDKARASHAPAASHAFQTVGLRGDYYDDSNMHFINVSVKLNETTANIEAEFKLTVRTHDGQC